MSGVNFYKSDNHLTIDSFNQNSNVKDFRKSSAITEKTQTVSQRAINLAYQTLMAPVNFGINFLKGVVISTGVDGVTSQGKSFKILYDAFFNPNCLENHFGIDRLSVYRSMAGIIVVRAPIMQEALFRGLSQDIILKRGVKKVVELVSPKHAGLVDSQAYTAARILVTSALFSFGEKKVAESFFSGIIFGLLKEKYGLASAIGAHMLHAFVPMAPDLFSSC